MKKIKNWMGKPITWGSLFKMYGISVLLLLPYYAYIMYRYRKTMNNIDSTTNQLLED